MLPIAIRYREIAVPMASTNIRLIFLAALCYSYLISMNGAIPITRSANLVQKSQIDQVPKMIQQEDVGESNLKIDGLMRRMDMEVNDYPGSGANNRHTPRPQLGRGCTDCW